MAAGLAAVFMSVSLAVGRLALDRGRALSTSRYAAELAASGLSGATIDAELSDYASRLSIVATLSTRRFRDLPSTAFYRLIAAETTVRAPRPPALGGGTWAWTDRAVLEED